jgi:hypothetical protein
MTNSDKAVNATALIGAVIPRLIRAATLLRKDGRVAAADRVWRVAVELMDVSVMVVDLEP